MDMEKLSNSIISILMLSQECFHTLFLHLCHEKLIGPTKHHESVNKEVASKCMWGCGLLYLDFSKVRDTWSDKCSNGYTEWHQWNYKKVGGCWWKLRNLLFHFDLYINCLFSAQSKQKKNHSLLLTFFFVCWYHPLLSLSIQLFRMFKFNLMPSALSDTYFDT